MARSHHRKKHKQHLRSYQNTRISQVSGTRKTKVKWIFTILAAATGLAIGFFASGTILWLLAGTFAGAVIGYFIGQKLDQQSES